MLPHVGKFSVDGSWDIRIGRTQNSCAKANVCCRLSDDGFIESGPEAIKNLRDRSSRRTMAEDEQSRSGRSVFGGMPNCGELVLLDSDLSVEGFEFLNLI